MIQELKRQAAEYAVDHFIQSNMIIGLGVGSTAIFATRYIGQKVQAGELENILAIACSKDTEDTARELGIPLTTLEEHPIVAVTIDGADEVSPDYNLIKGGGGALLREKIVAQASTQEIIVVDPSKLVSVLGTHWALPIEVSLFGWGSQANFLKSIGGEPQRRMQTEGEPYQTDQGNYILDCNFGQIHDPQALAKQLDSRAGIVEHGLFLNLATTVVMAEKTGIRILERR